MKSSDWPLPPNTVREVWERTQETQADAYAEALVQAGQVDENQAKDYRELARAVALSNLWFEYAEKLPPTQENLQTLVVWSTRKLGAQSEFQFFHFQSLLEQVYRGRK